MLGTRKLSPPKKFSVYYAIRASFYDARATVTDPKISGKVQREETILFLPHKQLVAGTRDRALSGKEFELVFVVS